MQRSIANIMLFFLFATALYVANALPQDQTNTDAMKHIHVRGQVIDEFDLPIAHAKAMLFFAFMDKTFSTIADAKGMFEIECDVDNVGYPHEYFDLWVYAKGYNIKCVNPQLESGTYLPCPVRLETEETILMRVVNEFGSPRPLAVVEPYYFDVPNGVYYSEEETGTTGILPPELAEVLRSSTDEFGEAEFTALPSRKLRGVYIKSGQMVPQLFRFKGKRKLEFQLKDTGRVQGKIRWNESLATPPDWSKCQVWIGSHEEIPIQFNGNDRFSLPENCKASVVNVDEHGQFVMDGVMVGDISVSVRLEGMKEAGLLQMPTPKLKLHPHNTVQYTIEIAKGIPVTGVLLTKDTREPIESAKISITSQSRTMATSVYTDSTDKSGKYRALLLPGQHMVQAYDISRSKHWKDYSYPVSPTIDIPPDAASFTIPEILFAPLARETGRLIDAKGRPIPNRKIAFIDTKSNHPLKYGESSESGDLDIRYDSERLKVPISTKWVIYPKSNQAFEGDVRQFPELTVTQETPLVLTYSGDL